MIYYVDLLNSDGQITMPLAASCFDNKDDAEKFKSKLEEKLGSGYIITEETKSRWD